MKILDQKKASRSEVKDISKGDLFQIPGGKGRGRATTFIKTDHVKISVDEEINCVNLASGVLDYKEGECIMTTGYLTLEN